MKSIPPILLRISYITLFLACSLRPGEYPGILRRGSTGTAVRELQFYLYLMSAYESSIPVVSIDGSFGAATENAVRAYQRFAKLTVDGVVGRTTWNSLYSKASILRVSGPVVTLKRLPYPGTPLAVGATGNAVLYYNLLLQRIAHLKWYELGMKGNQTICTALINGKRIAACQRMLRRHQGIACVAAYFVEGASTNLICNFTGHQQQIKLTVLKQLFQAKVAIYDNARTNRRILHAQSGKRCSEARQFSTTDAANPKERDTTLLCLLDVLEGEFHTRQDLGCIDIKGFP